jgi:hypothetical protein
LNFSPGFPNPTKSQGDGVVGAAAAVQKQRLETLFNISLHKGVSVSFKFVLLCV